MVELSYLIAFSAGILSFFSPCVLPLVPAYLANLVGVTTLNPQRHYRQILFHSLSFVFGFSAILVTLGISAGLMGSILLVSRDLLTKIAGSIIIVFGLFLIIAPRIPWLNYEKRLSPALANSSGYIRSLLLGALFSLGWTPCVGPILGAILTLALSSQTLSYGGTLLGIYSLGLGTPFILMGLAFGALMPLWKTFNRYSSITSLASGFLLIVLGAFVVANKLSWFI